jgi:nickel transport protein
VTRSLLALAALAVGSAAASAHGLGAEAKLIDGRVVVEVFFDDDTPAPDADVTVTDAAGAEAAFGRTDAAGRWSFPAPPAGPYKVVVDAGAGHRAKLALTVPAAPPGPATVSDGPTRAEFTGPQKWLLATAGVAAIAAGTWVVRRLSRSRTDRREPVEVRP